MAAVVRAGPGRPPRGLPAAVLESLPNLPDRTRTAVSLFLQGLSAEEVAERLETTPTAIWQLMHRLRRRGTQFLTYGGSRSDGQVTCTLKSAADVQPDQSPPLVTLHQPDAALDHEIRHLSGRGLGRRRIAAILGVPEARVLRVTRRRTYRTRASQVEIRPLVAGELEDQGLDESGSLSLASVGYRAATGGRVTADELVLAALLGDRTEAGQKGRRLIGKHRGDMLRRLGASGRGGCLVVSSSGDLSPTFLQANFRVVARDEGVVRVVPVREAGRNFMRHVQREGEEREAG